MWEKTYQAINYQKKVGLTINIGQSRLQSNKHQEVDVIIIKGLNHQGAIIILNVCVSKNIASPSRVWLSG